MLTDKEAIRITAAWDEYVTDRNIDKLLRLRNEVTDGEDALQVILWRAIGALDWPLVKRLELDGVDLPKEGAGDPGLLYSAVLDFGDAPRAIEWLLSRGASCEQRGPNDWTALHLACHYGYLGAIQALILGGSDINSRTSCDGGWSPLMEACAAGHERAVEELLGAGADPTIINSMEGMKAREIAKLNGHDSIVVLLDRAGRAGS